VTDIRYLPFAAMPPVLVRPSHSASFFANGSRLRWTIELTSSPVSAFVMSTRTSTSRWALKT
jgi:hypothetical protein